MLKNSNNLGPAMASDLTEHVAPSDKPLVEPGTVVVGDKTKPAELATIKANLSVGLVQGLSMKAEADKVRLIHQAEVAKAVGEYYKTVEETGPANEAGEGARARIEEATAKVSKAFADAILAGAYDRSKARHKLGESFGFKVSEKTKKPTSAPMEPGNSIAKRVASVTIAAEYAMSGELPDRGGDNLPLLGQEKVQELLADYFAGELTVRAASERIETAIREARVNLPLELSTEKLEKLAGKIETASAAIARDPALRDSYVVLFQAIAAIPFEAGEAEEDDDK